MNKATTSKASSELESASQVSALKIWHRRLGLSAAVFVLMLASTGLLLNHTSDWQLDQKIINSSGLLDWYGIQQAELLSYPLGDKFITRVGDEVFLNTREIAHCSGQLVGALELRSQGLIVIACDHELFLLSEQYELVERLGRAHGLPLPLIKIGLLENQLALSTDKQVLLADLDSLTWSLVDGAENTDESVTWAQAMATPKVLGEALGKHFVGEGLTTERLLLDIHSGRILGSWGVYLIDLMAVIFAVLAVTGFIMWLREPSRRT